MFAYIVGEFIAFLILLFPLSKYWFIFKYKIKNFKSTTKQLFKFGIPVMFTGIGGKIISYVDVLLLTYFASLTVLAIYNVVLPTAMMFLIFGTSIATVVYPMVSELWAKKDKIRISSGLESIYSYLFILTIPLISLIFIFSDILLNIFFGKDFLIGVPVFRILLVGVLFFALSKVNFASISGLGKPAIVTKIIFLSAGINLVMNLILIPIYGMIGAAVATSVSYILAFFLSTFKLTKFIEIKVPWKNWGKAVFASIIFIIIVAVLKKVIMMHWIPELIIVSVIAGVIYLVLIFWLKTITVSELKIQLKRIFS